MFAATVPSPPGGSVAASTSLPPKSALHPLCPTYLDEAKNQQAYNALDLSPSPVGVGKTAEEHLHHQ